MVQFIYIYHIRYIYNYLYNLYCYIVTFKQFIQEKQLSGKNIFQGVLNLGTIKVEHYFLKETTK